jgi:hypothetical protein
MPNLIFNAADVRRARKMAEMLANGATQIIIGFSEKELSLKARLPKTPAKKTGKK